MSLSRDNRSFALGNIEVHPDRSAIVISGTEKRLEPKVMEVLVYLAEASGGVVSRDDLLSEVWGRVVVSDETITRAISTLRAALEDSAQKPLYIETIPRRGYRLLVDAGPLPPADPAVTRLPPQNRARPRWHYALPMICAVALAAITLSFFWSPARDPANAITTNEIPSDATLSSIAIMPFEVSGDRGGAFVADGIHDALSNQLSSLKTIHVITKSTMHQYKERRAPVLEIAERLGVKSVLEGSVRILDNRVRVSAQLVDVPSGLYIWSDIYDRESDDLFLLESELASEIAQAMEQFIGDERVVTVSGPPTQNPEAYRLYLLGIENTIRMDPNELVDAVDLFRQATQLDPTFVLAWVGLADAIQLLSPYTQDAALREDLKHAIDRARTIAPQSPDVQASLAMQQHDQGNHGEAERTYLNVLKKQPNHAKARYRYGLLLRHLDRPEEALVQFRYAAQLDPLGPAPNGMLAETLWHLGRSEEALALVRQQLNQEPTALLEFHGLSTYLEQFGRLDEAAYWANRGAELNPKNYASRRLACERLLTLEDIDAAERCHVQMQEDFKGDARLKFWTELLLRQRKFEQLVELAESTTERVHPVFPPQWLVAYAHLQARHYERARVLYSDLIPPAYFNDVEFTIPQKDIDWAIIVGMILMNVDPPDAERANYLFDGALKTMSQMHRTRGGNFRHYGAWDLLITAARGDVEQATKVLQAVVDSNWRRDISFMVTTPLFEKFASNAEWMALVSRLDRETRSLRSNYYTHKDDHQYWQCKLDPVCSH